jgi:hypothetical protein
LLNLVLRVVRLQNKDPIVRWTASTEGSRRRMRERATPNLLYVDAPLFLLALAIGGWALAIGSPMFSAAVSAYLTQ